MHYILIIVAILAALKIAEVTTISWFGVLTPILVFLGLLAIPATIILCMIIYEAMKR